MLMQLQLPIQILASSTMAKATMQQAHDQAASYQQSIKLGNPSEHPQILPPNGDVSGLTSMNDAALTRRAKEAFAHDPAGELLSQTETMKINATAEHRIDPNNPWLNNSITIEDDPLKAAGGSGFSTRETVNKTSILKSCLDGASFNIDVIRQLHFDANLIDVWGAWQNKQISYPNVPYHWLYPIKWKKKRYGMHMKGDPHIMQEVRVAIAQKLAVELEQIDSEIAISPRGVGNLRECAIHQVKWDYYIFGYKYREKVKEFSSKGEYWEVLTPQTEELLSAHACHEVARRCVDNNNKVFFDRYTINRPCWKEQISYSCQSEPTDGCSYLERQGCLLQNSNCNNWLGGICLEWTRNYSCSGELRVLHSSLAGSEMFCLGGECNSPTIGQNNDLHNVAYLAVLNGVQKDMQKTPLEIFKGESTSCTKYIVNFLNCCSSMKGWGSDIRLCRCSGEARALALKKEKKLCKFVGSYCSERDPIFGKCLATKSSYCCFNSKLARIFQEQGRSQLGISWGSGEYPSCRGLTPAELQRIDFTRINVEELFEDVLQAAKGRMLKNFPTQLQNQMPVMQKNIGNPSVQNKAY